MKIFNSIVRTPLLSLLVTLSFLFTSCNEDDDAGTTPIGPFFSYQLSPLNDSQISAFIRFVENDDNSIEATLFLARAENGNTYPSHIHANSVLEGGDIVISLESVTVSGTTGQSTTTITQTDAGTAITFEELMNFDGHINLHRSPNDLTVIAQSDIGGNELTGTSQEYALALRDNSGTTGSLLLEQRKSGATLATLTLDSVQNLTDGASHPAHIHNNNAVEGGGIAVSFTPVSGTTGTSLTHIEALDDGSAITYEQLLDFDGYVNVHESAENLAILIVQGDIGANELTDDQVTYPLIERAVTGIKGEAVFQKRKNGETLATISLEGTPEGGEHPAHIHFNTAIEGGGIAFSFSPVNGTTGMSVANITALDDATPITYDELLEYNGYINVHLSADNLATIVAQGDIGQNALTGESITYTLDSLAIPSIKGEAIFSQRNNGTILVELKLDNTPDGGDHPAHIHANTAAEGGGIAISLNNVDGTTGISHTQVATFDDGTPVTYEGLLEYDGYINVHFSAMDLATIVAQGDIGQNALTGTSVTYALDEKDVAGISGNATFAQRKDGSSLVTIVLSNTPDGGDHPAHIHFNTATEGGGIAISLTNLDGTSGISKTSVMVTDNNVPITYEELLDFNGYINVHLSPADLATIVAQGDIGANAPE